MQRILSYRCPECGQQFTSLQDFGDHTRENHPGKIPEGWSDARYFYYVLTGNGTGRCRICKGPTQWNEATAKYSTLCSKQSCRETYRAQFVKNMEKKNIGRESISEDYDHLQKMIDGRKSAYVYTARDGKSKFGCIGDIELSFMQMMDTYLKWPLNDIMAPSPYMHLYYYDNPNEPDAVGNHFYIPDFYIPSLNLEIEIKTCRNVTKKLIAVDDVKESCKDEAMRRQTQTNYLKIYEKDYTVFFAFLEMVRNMSPDEFKKKTFCYIPKKPNYYKDPNFDKQMALAKSASLESLTKAYEENEPENLLAAYGYDEEEDDPDVEPLGDDEVEDLSVDRISKIFGVLAEEAMADLGGTVNLALESYGNYSEPENRTIPVFTILTIGNSPISPIIRKATGEKHSHASISFTPELDPMYSFGTKKIDGKKWDMGFVMTNPTSELWGEEPTPYDIYVTFVTKEAHLQMLETLNYFIANKDRFKYHWMGLIDNFFQIKSESKKKFICSQFVAILLGKQIKLQKDPSKYTPTQLGDFPELEFVTTGNDIREFNPREMKDKMRSLYKRIDIDSFYTNLKGRLSETREEEE